jgi:hypothetical protein
MAKFEYTVLNIPDEDIGRMYAALDMLGSKFEKPILAADGGPISGTKCGATNISGGNGNYDFNCKD